MGSRSRPDHQPGEEELRGPGGSFGSSWDALEGAELPDAQVNGSYAGVSSAERGQRHARFAAGNNEQGKEVARSGNKG